MAENTFSSIAQGYAGAQDTLRGLGMLPGSFRPMDGGGASLQVPTVAPMMAAPVHMPPPAMGNTLPFPTQAPQFHAPSVQPPMPMHPAMMPPRMNIFAPQQGMHMPPVPVAPQPMGVYQARQILMGNQTIGLNQNVLQARAQAARTYGAFEDSLPGMFRNMAISTGVGIGAGAVYGSLGGPGGTLAGAGVGLVAGTLAGMGEAALTNYANNYAMEREQHASMVGYHLRNVTSGNMVGAFGSGISPLAQMNLSKQLIGAAKQGGFNETIKGGDMTTTLGMASEMGLMRGHTNDIGQVVSRVKNLATVARDIMRLGEGITQQDAMELQALTQNLGISTGAFQQHNLGQKLVTAAKVSGMSPSQAMQQGFVAGSAAFQQAGMSSVLGGLTGLSTLNQAGSMINSGNLSASQIAAFGGQSGLQQSLLGAQTNFLAANMGSLALGSLNPDMSLNMAAFQHNLLGSGGSFRSMNLAGRDAVRGDDLTAGQISLRKQLVLEKMPEMTRKMQESMTPMQTNALMIRQITARMEESMATGRFMTDTQAAASLGISPEQYSAVKASMDNIDTQVRDINRQDALVRREKRARLGNEYQDRTRLGLMEEYTPGLNSFLNEMGEGFSYAFSPSKHNTGYGRMIRRRQRERAINAEVIEANAAGVRLGAKDYVDSRFTADQDTMLREEGVDAFLASLGEASEFTRGAGKAVRGAPMVRAPSMLRGKVHAGMEEMLGDDFEVSPALQADFDFLKQDSVLGGFSYDKYDMTATQERDAIYQTARSKAQVASNLKYFTDHVGESANRKYLGNAMHMFAGRGGILEGATGAGGAALSVSERESIAADMIAAASSAGRSAFTNAMGKDAKGRDVDFHHLNMMGTRSQASVQDILKSRGITLSEGQMGRLNLQASDIASRNAALEMNRTERGREFGGRFISATENVLTSMGNQHYAFNNAFKSEDEDGIGGRIRTFLGRLRTEGLTDKFVDAYNAGNAKNFTASEAEFNLIGNAGIRDENIAGSYSEQGAANVRKLHQDIAAGNLSPERQAMFDDTFRRFRHSAAFDSLDKNLQEKFTSSSDIRERARIIREARNASGTVRGGEGVEANLGFDPYTTENEGFKGHGVIAKHLEILQGSGLSAKDQKLAILAMGFDQDEFGTVSNMALSKGTGFNKDQIDAMRERIKSGDLQALGKKYAAADAASIDMGEGFRATGDIGDLFMSSDGKASHLDRLLKAHSGFRARKQLNVGLGNLGFIGTGKDTEDGDAVSQLLSEDFLKDDEIKRALTQSQKSGQDLIQTLLGEEGVSAADAARIMKSGDPRALRLMENQNRVLTGDKETRELGIKNIREIVKSALVESARDKGRQGASSGSEESANATDFGKAVADFKVAIKSMESYASGQSLEVVLKTHLNSFSSIRDSLLTIQQQLKKLQS